MIWSYPSRSFAIRAHGDQSYGGKPYEVHLDHVVQVLIRFGCAGDDRLIDAGFLHDTIEDTDTTEEDIANAFSPHTAKLVDAVTDGEGKTRKEKKDRPYFFIPKVPGAVPLKLADRIANTEACLAENKDRLYQMYQEELNEFSQRLYDPKCMGHVRSMWQYLDKITQEHPRM